MKITKLTQAILAASTLIICNQLQAAQLPQTNNDLPANLVTISVPTHKIEQESLHFSQQINADEPLNLTSKGYKSISDEYWFEVSGKELNQGVVVDISQPGALIRLSGKRNADEAIRSNAIDPKFLELSNNNTKLAKPFSQSVSQEQLATANIFPNSSAVKLNKTLGAGKFTLKVTQNLVQEQSYIINVKEKDSIHKLQLSLPNQSYVSGQTLRFNADITKNDQVLNNSSHKAFLKLPSGEKYPVTLQETAGQYQITLPQSEEVSTIGQLHELHLESQLFDKSLKVKRNGKIAFAMALPTAKMTDDVKISADQALIGLTVASEGRYEVSAIVSGTNEQGRSGQIMLSRSAHYLIPGDHQVALKFDRNILTRSGFKAPYTITNLRLMDQSRMALLTQR